MLLLLLLTTVMGWGGGAGWVLRCCGGTGRVQWSWCWPLHQGSVLMWQQRGAHTQIAAMQR